MAVDHKSAIDKEQGQINRVYAAMVMMLVFSCVPMMSVLCVSFLLLCYVMASAYILRARYPEESMVWNHMEYLIRTFWISSLIFLVGFFAYLAYVLMTLNIDSINQMSDSMLRGQFGMTPDLKRMIVAGLITMGPSFIYFIYRVAKGLSRALKGHRMGNVKAWF